MVRYVSACKEWIADINLKGYAGYHDWRLATLEEAISLMEPIKNREGLYINLKFDPAQKRIWTSDLYSSVFMWVIYFAYDYCVANIDNDPSYVRAVRSGYSSP